MLLAQALGEYAGVSTIAAMLSTSLSSARQFLWSVDPKTWAILATGLFLAFYVRNRFK